jgi:two-component system NtrC family sensor kinase
MIRKRFRLAEIILFLSLIAFFVFVLLARPPASFLVLLLGPIALAAVLYEFVGGLFAALAGMLAVALLLALDPHPARRATMLQEVWPLLVTYLAVGPFIGWLVSRERERERELAKTTQRLQVVQEIVEAINTSLDPQDTLQTIIAETQRLVPFERAIIMLKMGDLLRVVAVNDDEHTRAVLLGQAFQMKETAAGLAIGEREIWSGGPAEVSGYADTRLLCPEGVSSCLAIPIQFQQEVIGVFSLAGAQLEHISPSDLENLRQIVEQTALAIEHARLHRLERERAKALEAISEASREIAASLDLERTLQLVITKAAETLPMDAGALFVFDEASQLYRVKVSHNLPPEQVDKITFAFDEGVPGWVVKHRQPLIINNASADQRVHPYVVEVGIQSVLAVPLITRGELIGVLNLFCQTGTNAFDDEALGLAQVYADQAAVFIDNARLVEELRQAAAELEARVEQRTRELRQTQAQVIRAEKMAAVGRLAGSVAHEVNNPLQAIALHLQLIADEGLNPTALEQIVIVRQEFDRIAEIVQRLLDFQRPKKGRRAQQEIPALLDEVLALAGKQLQETGIRVTLEVEEELAPISAVGDQVKQVFLNLILNAIEAMPGGGELTIRGRGSAGQVVVSFADSGVGIAPEVMEQLFEPFFSTKHSGSGLGLAVSQEIVSAHGGTLEAGRRPVRGAVFTVRLPAYLQAEAVHVN